MNAPEALIEVLKLSGTNKGDRGEMVAMLLLLLAYDKARRKEKWEKTIRTRGPRVAGSLLRFLQVLLCKDSHAQVTEMYPARARPGEHKPLGNAFDRAAVYFTHFIRLQDFEVVHRRHLSDFMQRGAAILCPVNAAGFDIGIPFIYDGEGALERSNMGLILVRVKNFPYHDIKPHPAHFEDMNPTEIGVYDAEEDSPAPIIRMFFALAAPEGRVTAVGQQEQSSDSDSLFTAYDIWCGRVCRDTFGLVTKRNEGYYQQLLQMSYGTNPLLQSGERSSAVEKEIAQVIRSMCPSTTITDNQRDRLASQDDGRDEDEDDDHDVDEDEDE
jgi:hypothetical protein